MFASSSPNDPVTAVGAGPAGVTAALALPRPESASGSSTDRRFRATSPAATAYQAPYDVQRRFVERLSDHGLVRSVSKLDARYRRAWITKWASSCEIRCEFNDTCSPISVESAG
jgi:hypothetical protein